MTIESSWKRQYETLRGHIVAHPEIQIAPHEVRVPENARDGFYDCFDGVRRAFVKSRLGSLSFDAPALAKNYTESENRLCQIANHGVAMPLDLSSFLHDPEEGMSRLIYNRLFELLQGKISEDDFARLASDDLAADAARLFRLGYTAWAALALILHLEPDEFWGIGFDADGAPCIAEMKEIAFGRQCHHPARRVPEFLFHSEKLKSYVAFKMPLTIEVDAYQVPVELPTQRLLRNRNGDSSAVLDHRMIFLSVLRDLKEIPIFADLHARTINGPDLAIECLMEQDIADSKTIQNMQNRMEILQPRRAGCAVIMDPAAKPESYTIEEGGDNIIAFSAGLNPSGLRPIINILLEG